MNLSFINTSELSYLFNFLFFFSKSFWCFHLSNLIFTRVFLLIIFMASFCDGIHYACNTACHETPGMNLSLMFGKIPILGINILLIVLMLYNQGKSRKYLRFLRAAGPLTAVVLGTTFAKIFHPSSISLVSIKYVAW